MEMTIAIIKQILALCTCLRSSSDGTFTQQSKIHAEGDAAVSDQFGRSVSLYGDTL